MLAIFTSGNKIDKNNKRCFSISLHCTYHQNNHIVFQGQWYFVQFYINTYVRNRGMHILFLKVRIKGQKCSSTPFARNRVERIFQGTAVEFLFFSL